MVLILYDLALLGRRCLCADSATMRFPISPVYFRARRRITAQDDKKARHEIGRRVVVDVLKH